MFPGVIFILPEGVNLILPEGVKTTCLRGANVRGFSNIHSIHDNNDVAQLLPLFPSYSGKEKIICQKSPSTTIHE